MGDRIDDRLKQVINSQLDRIQPDVWTENRCLEEIHKKIEMRGKIMRFNKKKMVAALAAMCTITVLGTVTAVAGGKITSLISSSSSAESVHSINELSRLAKSQMGTVPKLVETFSNGLSFKEGSVINVQGIDDSRNPLLSYPQLYARYGEKKRVSLYVNQPQDMIPNSTSAIKKQEVYKDITLAAFEDNYLFLPPDATPSAEDSKLQDEGKLYISYGSDKEERSTYRYVNWEENGLEYSLSSFNDFSCDDLIAMAREVTDAK